MDKPSSSSSSSSSHFQRLSPRKTPKRSPPLAPTATTTDHDFVTLNIMPADNPYMIGSTSTTTTTTSTSIVAATKDYGHLNKFRVDIYRRLGVMSSIHQWPIFQFTNIYLAVLLVIWYVSCVAGTIVNARMMKTKEFAYPVILSVIHLVITVIVDWVIIIQRGVTMPTSWKILVYSVPVAMFLAVTKCLTYVSYSKVPASLTQTVRSAAPLFSVLITKFWHARVPSFLTCLSLVPITAGVCLSAVSEIDFELWGFISAALATAAGVLQTTYTKDTLVNTDLDALVFHLYTSLIALLLTAPFGFSEYRQFWLVMTDITYTGPVRVTFSLTTLWMLFMSVVCIYGQNIASIYFLKEVNVLTHTVANTLKRLVIIVGTVMYFHNDISPQNAAGMAIALAGFGAYGASRAMDNRHKRGKKLKQGGDDHGHQHHQHHHKDGISTVKFNGDAVRTRRQLPPV